MVDSKGQVTIINASDKGGNYFAAVVITNVPVGATLTVEIKAYTDATNFLTSDLVSFEVVNDNGTIILKRV